MNAEILPITPAEIEAKSFAIIEDEFFKRTGRRQEDSCCC